MNWYIGTIGLGFLIWRWGIRNFGTDSFTSPIWICFVFLFCVILFNILYCLWIPHPPPSPTRGHAAWDNLQTVMPGIHGWYKSPDWLATAPRATYTNGVHCLFVTKYKQNKGCLLSSLAWPADWSGLAIPDLPSTWTPGRSVLCCRH